MDNLILLQKELISREIIKGNDFSSSIKEVKSALVISYILKNNLDYIPFKSVDEWIISLFGITNQRCINKIIQGLEANIDVSVFAKTYYNVGQMHEIFIGLQQGVDISIFASKEFDFLQMEIIREGLVYGMDVSLFAKEHFDSSQMYQIRTGLEQGIDASIYAKKEISSMSMRLAREELLRKRSEKEYPI